MGIANDGEECSGVTDGDAEREEAAQKGTRWVVVIKMRDTLA
jgi:hypothetical protein